MAQKKKGKSNSARSAWVIFVALIGLAFVGAWYVWNNGGYERFTGWFYGDKVPPAESAAAPAGKNELGENPEKPRAADPLWRGADGRAGRVPPKDAAGPIAPAGIQRTNVTLKQAARLVEELTGGKARSVRGANTPGRYLFEVDDGARFLPFDTEPVFVEFGHQVMEGPFGAGGADAFVATMAVENPEGPQWQSRYAGVIAWRGRPAAPGPRMGSAALQAPGGWFVRTEALDAEGNGAAEILLEVEYRGPQGLLMREASVWFLGSKRSQKMWNGMTLDDAPGLGAEEAKAWDVKIVPARGGKGADLQVTELVKRYKVGRDLSRTPAGDQVIGISTVPLPKGRRSR